MRQASPDSPESFMPIVTAMAANSETLAGNLKRLFTDTFGWRGSKNITSWALAGGLAYYFIYLPEQQRRQQALEEREAARQLYIQKGIQDLDRARPRADPQDTGLLKGSAAAAAAAASAAAASAAAAAGGSSSSSSDSSVSDSRGSAAGAAAGAAEKRQH